MPQINNDKHSGALIVFSKEITSFDDESIRVEQSYIEGNYYVYELRIMSSIKEIILGGETYSFERSNKPAIFIKSENAFDDNEP